MPLHRQVFALAIWPFLEQLLNFLVGFVDMAIAGRLPGDQIRLAAIDALAIAAFIAWLSGLMFGAVGTGATALISRAIGGRHKRLANAGLAQGILLACFMGVAGLVFLLVASGLIGTLFIQPANDAAPTDVHIATIAQDFCQDYLFVFGLGLPCAAILFLGSAALRGAGDTRSPFLAMCLVNLVNVITSIFLAMETVTITLPHMQAPLIVLPGAGLQVIGIALGTTISWTMGAGVILWLLISGRTPIRLRWFRLKPHWHTMKRIIKVGLPTLAESAGVWLINGVVLKMVSAIAITGALGAHMIAVRLEAISYLPAFAIGIAAASLAGQYLGLGDSKRAQRAVELSFGLALVTMSALGIAFMVVPLWMVKLVSPDTEAHLIQAPILLVICGVIQPFFAMTMVFGQALRGIGDTKSAMLISFSSMLMVRLVLVYVLGFVWELGLVGIWIGLCADLVVRGLLFAGRFAQGRWKQIQV